MKRLALLFSIVAIAIPAQAWNAHGHRLVARLALEGLPKDAPAWLKDESVVQQVAWQSNEADRWRGWQSVCLGHENKPDHFLDVEDLEHFGLTLRTIPPLRNEYLRALAIAKHEHPGNAKAYDAAKDNDRTKEWPGFLPHAICEHYAKLQAAFNQIRILERSKSPPPAWLMQQARANAVYHMGMLSHFVGDTFQPLHTTTHYNGWVGENPRQFTVSNKFHSYIDGAILDKHRLTFDVLKPVTRYDVRVDARNPWNDALGWIEKSHTRVVPLYELEKSGRLTESEGREFMIGCLSDAGATLSALYQAAWASSGANDKQIADYNFFDGQGPGAASAPASAPSGAEAPAANSPGD